jgi:hypothetical protein
MLSWEPSIRDAILDAIKGIGSHQSAKALLSFSWRKRRQQFLCECFALCTLFGDEQVGQEGVGQEYQLEVRSHSAFIAMMIGRKPQALLGLFEENLDLPTLAIGGDDLLGCERPIGCK